MEDSEIPNRQERCSPQTAFFIQKIATNICSVMDSNDAIAITQDAASPEMEGHQAVVVESLQGAPDTTCLDLTMPSSPDFLKKGFLGSSLGRISYTLAEGSGGVMFEISSKSPIRRRETHKEDGEYKVISDRDATEEEGRAILADLEAVYQHIGDA